MSRDHLSNLSYGLDVVRRRLWAFLSVALSIFTIGIAIVFLLPRVYRSEARILIDTPQINSPAIAGETVSTDSLSDWIDRIEQRVTTRQRLLELADVYQLFSERWARLLDSYNGRKDAADAEIAEAIRSRIQITPVYTHLSGLRRTGMPLVFTIAFEYDNAEIAAKVTTALVQMIISEDVKSRKVRASETARFIEREAERIKLDLALVETQIASFTSQYRNALPDRMEFQVAEVRSRQNQLDRLDTDIRSLTDDQRLLSFELRMKLASQGASSATANSAERLQALRTELARKQAIYASAHPQLRAIREEISVLEASGQDVPGGASASDSATDAEPAMASAPDVALLSERLKAMEPKKERLAAQRAEIVSEIGKLKDVIATFPEVKSQLLVLERQRTSVQASYDDVARKLNVARLNEKLEQVQQTERFEVLELPVVPQYPARPDRKKFAALVFLLSISCGAACAVALEFYASAVGRVLRRSSDLRRVAGNVAVSALPEIARRQTPRERKWLASYRLPKQQRWLASRSSSSTSLR